MVVRRITSTALVLLAAACAKDAKPAADTSATAVAPAAAATAAGGSCPRTGHWGDCQLRARLESSGLAPQATTEQIAELPSVGVTPVVLTLGNASLAAYFFPDTLARRKAAASLDTLKFIPQSKPVGILREGTVIENDNALVLLFSKNEHQRERVADAVTAGPPQP